MLRKNFEGRIASRRRAALVRLESSLEAAKRAVEPPRGKVPLIDKERVRRGQEGVAHIEIEISRLRAKLAPKPMAVPSLMGA